MFNAILNGKTGLINQQVRMDTIADNIANINTVGYKTSRLDFQDALYQSYYGRDYSMENAEQETQNIQKGNGVMVGGIAKDFFNNGSIQTTHRELDFALEGEGFFEVMDPNGNLLYTRQGTFDLSVEADGAYLVTADGNYVLNPQGQRIAAPLDTSSIAVSDDGRILFTSPDGEYENSFALYTFTNKTGLSVAGGANYQRTEASGDMRVADDVKVHQGCTEMSNVRMEQEMTRLIRTQRAFSLASRCVTVSDDMEGIANSMKR